MSAQQIDEKKLERAIRKIKHCLALAQSANENEAATALRQAQALMREYRLTEMDVKLSDVGEVESDLHRAKRRPAWDQQLSIAVADAFNCTTLRRRKWSPAKEQVIECATFVGVAPAQNIALYAYESLHRKLTQARKEYCSAVRSGIRRSEYSAETAGDHFALAWVWEVQSKLKALVPQGDDDPAGQSSTGQGLVAIQAQDKALISEFLATQDIRESRKRKGVELDMNAQIAGMLAGSKVELHAGIARGGDEILSLSASV
jgi:type II secretory pathway pseudopilin PulG